MSTYVSLHNHSAFSMLDGHGQVDPYMERAAELGMPALAVTDHGNLHAWLDFYDAGKKYGVKPVLGIEAYQARKTRFDKDPEELSGKTTDELKQRGPYHLTMLAKNLDGYTNLIKMSSESYMTGFYRKPRIDISLMEQHSSGVIVLSGCLGGEVCQALLRDDYDYALAAAARMQEIFGKENYFIEVMRHGNKDEERVLPDLLKIAKAIGAKPVISGDCHYVHEDQKVPHEILLCAQTGGKLADEDRFQFDGDGFHLKSYEEMIRDGADEAWLDNTLHVSDMIDVELNLGELYFPKFPIPTQESEEQYFERLVWEGIRERYGENYGSDVRERTEHELRVVKKMGFPSYFLVVSDLVNWAKSQGIRVGWGRGSAAGSIISYALKITNLDPLHFGLLFERFLVEGRKSMPDIDLDFDDRRRHEVINYARETYGENRVAHIGTFSRIKAKSAIKDVARVLGYDFVVGNEITKKVPPPVLGIEPTIQDALDKSSDFRNLYETDADAKKIIDLARGIEGVYRQTGIHAAGVVISQTDITDFVPIMRSYKDDVVGPTVTQWDMHRVEECGLLKVDFLGLTNLGTIDICVDIIKDRRGIEVDIDNIEIDDELTYQKMREGYSMGTFQLESSGMRQMMVALQPTSIEDVMALISLYRPGPLGSGMDKMFIAGKHGGENTADHPLMAKLLESTYGFMLYQEDVLKVSRELAGFTAAEADDLRKAIGKKQMDKIGLFRQKFVEGCKEVNDIDSKTANKIYSDIEYFGGYGFNLAHAASYAMVSYVTSYLKFNYPAEYMAALLSTTKTKTEAAKYLNECRNMKINVLPPSINKSLPDFKVETDDTILFGLGSVNGIGPAVISAILEFRTNEEYFSVYDFMRRTSPDVLNKGILEHLIGAGALDELVLPQKEKALSRDEKMVLLDGEKEQLGLYITEHPLTGVWHTLKSSITTTVDDLDTVRNGESITLGGILTTVQEKTTKRGDKMFILMLEDMTGSTEILVFPKEAKGVEFQEGDIVLISGKISQEGDDEHLITKVFFSGVSKPDIPQFGLEEPIIVKMPRKPDYGTVNRMKELIHKHAGNHPVYIQYMDEQGRDISLRFKRPANRKIKEELQTLGRTLV